MPEPTQTVHIELEREEAAALLSRIAIEHLRPVEESARDKLRAALSSSPEQGGERLNDALYERAAREVIATDLRRYPEVRWDRFIEYDGKLRVYGWLPREDGRADFLLLDYNAATGVLTDWITSAHPHPASVVKRLEGEASVECQRVEDHFSVPNAVRLSEERPQPPAPALSDEEKRPVPRPPMFNDQERSWLEEAARECFTKPGLVRFLRNLASQEQGEDDFPPSGPACECGHGAVDHRRFDCMVNGCPCKRYRAETDEHLERPEVPEMSRPASKIGPEAETQSVPGPNPPGTEELAKVIAQENYWDWNAEDVRRGCRRLARRYVEAAAPALRKQERQRVREYAEQRAQKCERWLADSKESGREELQAAINAYRDVAKHVAALDSLEDDDA